MMITAQLHCPSGPAEWSQISPDSTLLPGPCQKVTGDHGKLCLSSGPLQSSRLRATVVMHNKNPGEISICCRALTGGKTPGLHAWVGGGGDCVCPTLIL